MKKRKIIKYCLVSLAVIGSLFVVGGVAIATIYGDTIKECYKVANEKVEAITANEFNNSQTSLIYDADNNLLMKVRGDKENYYLLYEEIPSTVKNAFIAIEDHRFLEHHGIDYVAIARAAVAILLNGGDPVQGGSTITQQLARNVFLTTEKSISRKLTEIFIAVQLEKMYSKEDILEFYINNINFSNECYGIEAAAQEYFGTTVGKLSDSQIAFLCAIPQNPTYNNPRKYMTNTLRRRDNIIRSMLEYGYITPEDAGKMLSEKITLVESEDKNNNYLETYAKHAAVEAIMDVVLKFKFDYTLTDEERMKYTARYDSAYAKAEELLETDGYTIYTSLSLSNQGIVQNKLDEILTGYTDLTTDGEYSLQGAVTLIDNKTGLVTAIVGGRTPLNHLYTINRAYQSYRQPGSSIKPLVAYTPYFDNESTSITDIKQDWTKPAYDGQKVPKGTGKRTTVINAIKWSYNCVPWNIVRELTPETSLAYLTAMNFHKIVDADKVEAISLGGFTKGVSTLEMAGAYSAIARDGMFIPPTCITKIVDTNGNTIFSYKDLTAKRVYTEHACGVITKCMESVVDGGTGTAANITGIDVAGKTGTSNDEKDSWFAGFTPYYTAAIWVGHDIPKSEPSVSTKKITATLFSDIMTPLHKTILESSDEKILTFKEAPIGNANQSNVIFDKISKDIDLLSNVEITSEASYKDFSTKYEELESLINSSSDVLSTKELSKLKEKLETVKRTKWDSILEITNSQYTVRGWEPTSISNSANKEEEVIH